MLQAETQRIVNDLHKGVSAHPARQLVYNRAGDVLAVINALWEETKRADVAEARLAAVERADDDTAIVEESPAA